AGRRSAGPPRARAIGSPPMPLDPARTVAELRELQALTGDGNGAQRVAWTDTWVRAREWLGEKLAGLPLELVEDEAANQWWTLRGEAAHAGSTPMDKRRDALAGAAKLELEIREIARRVGEGAVCTMGGVVTKPGIVTSVVETADCLLDQRHLDAVKLAEMLDNAKAASRRFAQDEELEVEWERIWNIEPILFDERLIELADESIREVAGTSHRLPSGPLHDAAEVARAVIPTVMLFVQSLRGLSHTKLEDTKEEHLELSVRALDRLTDKVISLLADGS